LETIGYLILIKVKKKIMKIENYHLDKDINVFCITAKSFPDGVLEAHQKLHSLIPFSTERKYFGLSRPEKGVITYKAAAEEKIKGEAEKLDCETLVIKKGKYISTTIKDYIKDVQSIGRAFQQLLATPGLAHDGYCVEWYLSDKDVKCMVRLENE
jgi:predicted transcriptional regulator YdeE